MVDSGQKLKMKTRGAQSQLISVQPLSWVTDHQCLPNGVEVITVFPFKFN